MFPTIGRSILHHHAHGTGEMRLTRTRRGVRAPGTVASGDIIRLVERCHPDWTVARTFRILISTAPTRLYDIVELAGLPKL